MGAIQNRSEVMNKTEKLLRAFIEASGYEIEEVTVDKEIPNLSRPERSTMTIKEVIDYKVTKRKPKHPLKALGECVPLEIHGQAWSSICEYIISHSDDIERSINDYGDLLPAWEFMNRNCK